MTTDVKNFLDFLNEDVTPANDTSLVYPITEEEEEAESEDEDDAVEKEDENEESDEENDIHPFNLVDEPQEKTEEEEETIKTFDRFQK